MHTMRRRFSIRNAPAVPRRHLRTLLTFLLALCMLSVGALRHRRQRAATPPPRLQLIYRETRFNGLGSQALRLLDAYALAEQLNASLCVSEGRYWNYGCAAHRGWSCYFTSFLAPPRGCAVRPHCAELAQLRPAALRTNATCVLISSAASYARAAAALRRPLSRPRPRRGALLQRSRKLAADMWRFNDDTRAAVRRAVRRVQLSEPYVALHVRRGDKNKERPLVPLEQYARAVKLLANETTAVFVATDDGSVLTELRYYLRGRTVVSVEEAKNRKGHVQAAMNRVYLKNNVARVVTLLAEIEIMRGASLFICTFSSNLGRLVHLLRWQRADSSVSLDDRWDAGVAWRTFGQQYCEWEEANQVYCNSIKYKKNQ